MARTRPVRRPFGEVLHELLTEAHVSQAELGRRVGQHESTISRLIRGSRRADPALCMAIANALQADPNPLLVAANWLQPGYRLGESRLSPEQVRLQQILPPNWHRTVAQWDNLDAQQRALYTGVLQLIFSDPPSKKRVRAS